MLRVGIVGHRVLDDPDVVRFVADASELILRRAGAGGEVVALSAAAEGADTLFAEAALRVGVPLELVRPYDGYAGDFETDAARARYHSIRRAAAREIRLDYRERCEDAYVAAMRWITDESDLLVAAWDGLPALAVGGTADTFRRARALGRPVIHLDVVTGRVAAHGTDRRAA